jgi:hypothetical protein
MIYTARRFCSGDEVKKDEAVGFGKNAYEVLVVTLTTAWNNLM